MKENKQNEDYYKNVSIEDLVKIYETTEKSWRQIAKENEIPLWLIHTDKDKYYRQAKRLEPKKHHTSYKDISKDDLEMIIEEYINTEVTWGELAERYGVSLATLARKRNSYMTEKGIEEIEKHQPKQESIDTMKISIQEIYNLYKEEKSVRRVANKLGLPNKIVRLVLRQMLLEDEKLLAADFVQILQEQGFELEDIKQEANKRGIEMQKNQNIKLDLDEELER